MPKSETTERGMEEVLDLLLAPPLYSHPPWAYNLFPTAVPVSWPQKAATMYAVLTLFVALGSMV
jgi:hypothetical protein